MLTDLPCLPWKRQEQSETEPQLSLRCYNGMDESLMDKAVSVIGEGCTYPILYNDDVNVDAVAKAFRISKEEAEQYVPFGCGEYVIDHKSFGTPSGIINLLKILEITLHNGTDPDRKSRRHTNRRIYR